MLKPLELLLLVCLVCVCVPTRAQDWRQCPVRDYTSPAVRDRGTLGSLLDTARVTRDSIVSNDLPYEDIRREISEVYNQSGLSVEPFVSLWIQYSENYLYLSSFVLFVGVVFPLVVVGLWAFWECCHETDREHDDQDDHRHHTVRSQALTWSLSVIVFLLLLLLCVFLGVLLAGNSLVSSGVRSGGVAVGVVLPELARVRDNALEQVEHLLVDDYNQLLESVEGNVLNSVGPGVAAAVTIMTQNDTDAFQAILLEEVKLAHSLHNHTESLVTSLSGLQSMLLAINESLVDLLTSCNAVMNSALGNSSVGVACGNLTAINADSLYPRIHGDVEGWRSLLTELNQLLPIQPQPNTLNTTLVAYLTDSTLNTTTDHIGHLSSFGRSIENFLQETVGYYNSTLTFDLPNSQSQLDEFLGPRYLGNWEVIRYACTLTFALFVLVLGVCLLVPIGRGLLSTVYNGEDDMNHLETAHQAGATLKKVTFVLVGVCAVSAAGFGVFLVLGGVLGRSCGRHGNFSSLLDNVVDHSDSWDDGYPLGDWIIGNTSYPLTVGGVVNSCRGNLSLYESLQLGVRLNLSSLSFSEQAQSMYHDAMRGLANTLPLYTPLTPSQASLLTLLHNTSTLSLNWSLPLVPDAIFTQDFIGLSQLQQIINSTESAVLGMSSSVGSVSSESLSASLSSAESALTDLIAYITADLIPSVNESGARLAECLVMSQADHVMTVSEALAVTVRDSSITLARRELSVALDNVTQQLLDYSSSSQQTLQCQAGSCLSLATLFDQFTTAFCTELVPGIDIYWTTLLAILTLSLLILLLSLFLASRFIDPDLKEAMAKKFHLWSSVLEQLRALSWLLLSLGIALWFVVTVATDEFFLMRFCDGANSICCVQCVWGVGVVFILLAAIVGGVSRVYQCVIVYRITQCAHAKVKRYWVDRKNALQFYTQLLILLLQDVPFLILAGVYTTRPNPLTVSALFTITSSLTGILAYILYLVLERGNILAYCTWLKKALTINGCPKKATLEVTSPEGLDNGHANGGIPMMNRRRPRGRYGSSESDQSDDSQTTTQQDGDWQYATTRLSNIPEQPEGLEMIRRAPLNLSPPSPPRSYLSPSPPPGRPLVHVVPHLEDSGSYSELSQAQGSASVMLDHLDPSNESALALRREAAIQQPMVGGVEIAPRGFATPTSSDCGSIYTVSEYPGYLSSQPADDYYRDEYSDSDLSQLHSQRGGRHILQMGVAIGEVSMDV